MRSLNIQTDYTSLLSLTFFGSVNLTWLYFVADLKATYLLKNPRGQSIDYQ
jgi:hypothetical protein